jgi:hypothetical protein
MTDEQKTRIKEYATTLSGNVAEGELLDLVVDEVADRVLLYLNETTIAEKLERVIAQVIVSVYKRTEADATGTGQSVSTVSDNGQSITYRVSPAQYLASSKDQEIFTGYERLLSPYRRVHVIAS